MAGLKIGQAARAAQVNVETIRYYERRGLLTQPMKPVDGRPRLYDPASVSRLRFIKDAARHRFFS